MERIDEPEPPQQLQQPRPLTPPPEWDPEVDWGLLEGQLAGFDGPQLPDVIPQLEQNLPKQPIDWALITYVLVIARDIPSYRRAGIILICYVQTLHVNKTSHSKIKILLISCI